MDNQKVAMKRKDRIPAVAWTLRFIVVFLSWHVMKLGESVQGAKCHVKIMRGELFTGFGRVGFPSRIYLLE